MPNIRTPTESQNAVWNKRQIAPQPYIPADMEKIKNTTAVTAPRITSITEYFVFIDDSNHLECR